MAGVTVSGSWGTSSWAAGGIPMGADFRYADGGSGANTVTWPLGVGSAGTYRLYARWTSGSDRNTAAPYAVTHDGGTTTVNVDQRYNGGQWISLGVFDLTPSSGHQVVLSDLGARTVADAILVVPLDEIVPPPLSVAADAVKLVANDAEDVLYVHADHLGAPQKMTDDTGTVMWDAAFTPFGQQASITGAASNGNRFPGQSLDDETALHYNYWRSFASTPPPRVRALTGHNPPSCRIRILGSIIENQIGS